VPLGPSRGLVAELVEMAWVLELGLGQLELGLELGLGLGPGPQLELGPCLLS